MYHWENIWMSINLKLAHLKLIFFCINLGPKTSIMSAWYIVSRLCDTITQTWFGPNCFPADSWKSKTSNDIEPCKAANILLHLLGFPVGFQEQTWMRKLLYDWYVWKYYTILNHPWWETPYVRRKLLLKFWLEFDNNEMITSYLSTLSTWLKLYLHCKSSELNIEEYKCDLTQWLSSRHNVKSQLTYGTGPMFV